MKHISTPISTPLSTHLREGMGRDGLLSDIIELDGEDFLLAKVGSVWVELPRTLSAQLWGLLGQKIRTARLDGKYRVGKAT
jgi:hypothetical protein